MLNTTDNMKKTRKKDSALIYGNIDLWLRTSFG